MCLSVYACLSVEQVHLNSLYFSNFIETQFNKSFSNEVATKTFERHPENQGCSTKVLFDPLRSIARC